MLPFTSAQRYFLCTQPTDMRKSFDGLCGLVLGQMKANPLSGDVFIFVNRVRDRIKLLVWDRTGFVICYKRLEQGTFQLPVYQADATTCSIRWDDLVLILEGVDLRTIKRRKRYTHATLPT